MPREPDRLPTDTPTPTGRQDQKNPPARTPLLRIVLVALIAGVLGVVASVMLDNAGHDQLRIAIQEMATGPAPAPPPGTPIAAQGERMPDLQLAAITGNTVALPRDYAGRPILINFWASWCGPCVEEMPELQRFAESQGATGVQVVGIALDDKPAVEAFLRKLLVTYPVLIDVAGPGDSSVQLGNRKGLLPYSVLIDPQGRLARRKIGPFQQGDIEEWVN